MTKKKHTVIIGIILFLVLAYSLLLSAGEFSLRVGTQLQEDSLRPNENFYFGYELLWKGPIAPVLESVELAQKDGRPYRRDGKLEIDSYVDYLKHTGVLNEEMYQELLANNRIDLRELKGHRVDEDFTLVLRVRNMPVSYQEDFGQIVLHYRQLGLKRRQVLEFSGFTCK